MEAIGVVEAIAIRSLGWRRVRNSGESMPPGDLIRVKAEHPLAGELFV